MFSAIGPVPSRSLAMKTILSLALLCAASLHAATQITWERKQLHGDFYSEGAGIGDINGDEKPDIVAGPFWWEGPAFAKRHAYYEPKIFSINGYSDNFFVYVYDFNGDKRNDILILGFPGKEARLYLNPGALTSDTPWNMHIVADVVDNESPVFTDITGDGKPEIVCSTGGKFGWFAPNWERPTEKWPFVAISDDMKVAKFTHGLGVGDVNGDGKLDLLEARRWWENDGAAVKAGQGGQEASRWAQHNFAAGVGGGAQMFAYDFDGNGLNDVFTSLAAHRYGVAVYLQQKQGSAGTPARTEKDGGEAATKDEADKSVRAPLPTWKRVMLASENPADNDYGIVFSQPHAAHLADINGDGIMDIVTGKRYWAHNGHDPDERGARVIYWYETKRDGKGGVDFVPHLVDANSGVGVDVQVGDVNGDTFPDIVVGNKAGVFILTQHRVAESLRDSSSAGSGEIKGSTSAKDTSHGVTGLPSPVKMYGPALKAQKDYAHGQSPQDALKAIQLPTGFKAELIAAEPDIVQPIAFTFDERGRIWVIEGLSYPQPREPGAGQDRIKILEDKDGDGTFETKKIFCEGINLASGIELGFGGVWVGAAPYLMFIPRDGDKPLEGTKGTQTTKGTAADKTLPSLESFQSFTKVPGLNFTAYALLDGWGHQDTHETLNSFIWGPDGWLYGCHGVFTHSKVGKPGTPDEQRTPINAGVWRYHPVRHVFEVFAHGTSNPWGLDYDQHGEFFVTACVIPHLYHIVPGGRYQRQGGQHFNPYTYEDIKTIADHAHYAGNVRDNAHWGGRDAGAIVQDDTNSAGGGHAHCGLAIYQSNQFPATYRNALIFGNLHGHRLVMDYLDVNKSTYIGKHGSDFMRSNDMNFIPVTQKVGPDGALYVSDWSDKQVCHRGSGAVELWDRSNGRIYRVAYPSRLARKSKEGQPTTPLPTPGSGEPAYIPPAPFDLAKESDETLAKLAVQTENEWFSRMARRVLAEHFERTNKSPEAAGLIVWKAFLAQKDDASVLRALWLMAAGYIPPKDIADFNSCGLLIHQNARVRAWVWRLLTDDRLMSSFLIEDLIETGPKAEKHRANLFGQSGMPPITALLTKEASPTVRRTVGSILERVSAPGRAKLASALVTHGEDKDDPMIPLLIWYGIEPLVGADANVGFELAMVSKIPKVTDFIYRRLADTSEGRLAMLRLLAVLVGIELTQNQALKAGEARAGPKKAVPGPTGGTAVPRTGDSAREDDGPKSTFSPDFSPEEKERILTAVITGARAAGRASAPEGWPNISGRLRQNARPKVAAMVDELAALYGDEEALETYRQRLAAADNTAAGQREEALRILLQARDAATAPLLLQLIRSDDKALTRRAVQALATLAHPDTAALLTANFASFDPATQIDAVNTLATTAAGAKALLTAVKAKQVPQTMLSPFLARQIATLKNAEVDALLKETFGDLNAPKPDLEQRKQKFRARLRPADLAKAETAKGRVIFSAVCGSCHRMLGEGQNVGPDLTGSNRANLDYLLDNVLDPNAVIGKDYQLNIFELADGRVASGVVKEESAAAFRIALPGGLEQTITAAEVKKRTVAKVSTMPEGLFDALPQEQLLQLVAYLQSNVAASGRTRNERPAGHALASAATVPGVLEGESLKVLAKSGGNPHVQGMAGFRDGRWSNGAQLWWTGGKPGHALTLAIPVAETGRYALKAVLTQARDYGVIDVALDGKPVTKAWDGYNFPAAIVTDELDWGTHEITAGEHQLTLTITGANPQAVKSYMVGVDYVRLEKR